MLSSPSSPCHLLPLALYLARWHVRSQAPRHVCSQASLLWMSYRFSEFPTLNLLRKDVYAAPGSQLASPKQFPLGLPEAGR